LICEIVKKTCVCKYVFISKLTFYVVINIYQSMIFMSNVAEMGFCTHGSQKILKPKRHNFF